MDPTNLPAVAASWYENYVPAYEAQRRADAFTGPIPGLLSPHQSPDKPDLDYISWLIWSTSGSGSYNCSVLMDAEDGHASPELFIMREILRGWGYVVCPAEEHWQRYPGKVAWKISWEDPR